MNIHGFKKQKGQAQKPHIAKDDLVSVSYANILYGLAEGEIDGLADGGKSIKLDGTPLINDNGQPNFTGVNFEFRTGTLDQSHIAGFPAVENEQNIGVELRSDRPWVKAITNRELSAVRVRLNFNALREQKDNGDVVGYAIAYAIDVQMDGGSFVEVLTDTARGKASSGYKKSHRIELPQPNGTGTAKRWTIRVRRITPNRNSELISDTVHIDALTEIIDAKLAYPCTALLGLSYDAKTFANIAKLAVRLKGKIIQVPSNYNAQTRQYNGLWDGTFKLAYSNNPAWVFYDLCTHKRYGLGERLAGMVDKWRLYQIGQYCDEMVDDGKGGQEPRFTVNVYIQKADDAYRVLQNLASVFRGLSFWDGSNIVVDADTPKEAVYTFSPANVVGGEFAYTGTRARDRHTLAKVAWDNPENGFNTEYELIPDEQAIAKYGVRTLDISAFGCTSKGQAQRAGLWALKAEQLETQTVSFKTGLMGFIPQVGQVINIADNVFAGRAVSGKIVAVSANKRQITLDRVAGKVGDTITVNTGGEVQTAKIVSVRGDTLTLDKAVGTVDDVWAVISDDLKLMQFRILTIAQNDDATFDITALEYNAQKYAVVDNGAIVTPQPYTVLKATPITVPNSVTLTASTRTVQGQAVTTLTINWEQVQGATAYIVEWRKDDGNWQTLPKVSGQSVDIDGVYAGNYTARVRAVDSYDNESLATTSQLTNIVGKTGKPPRLTSLTVQGILFGMNLGWGFNKGSEDTNFTEIQVSPDGRSNITTLGTFAYPTNKHEITGLQGGLTQFYRGRIVDKLGNTSDWTAWVRGVTDNQAEKVLNLISGQISESHLHQSLSTPIAKIGGLETDLNGVKTQIPTIRNEITNAKTSLQSAIDAVNSQLPTLNSQIATLNGKATNLQNELNTAKNTLQTAVNNITTERNRINTAIRDITALQTANNAKTQELANLTQTVNDHTSQVRELAVTTGDLSQKYTQLKTATDTANSEITAIKQTQNGQAVSIERLSARFDNGNLFKVSTATNGHFLDENNGGQLTAWASHRASDFISVKTNTVYEIRSFEGNFSNLRVMWYDDGKNFIKGQIIARSGDYATFDSENASFVRISSYWTRTDNNVWQMQVAGLASDVGANLETLRQTLTNADTALSQQITAMDTAYKSADRQLTANLASETTARTSADTALGQRIDSLQTDYNGNKASVANQLKTLSDKDTATASQISSLTANVSTAQNTANTANGKADNTQSIANNALNRANTANTAITNEQKARADADTALGQRITAIDTAYKTADSQANAKIAQAEKAISDTNTALSERITALDTAYQSANSDLTARLAREETARATGDNANSQALRTLESTVQGVSGRVGTSEGKIASLERTTSDLNGAIATTQNQLNARFDGLAVGGRNLLLNTQRPTADKPIYHTTATAPRLDGIIVVYENEVMTVQATKASNRYALAVWSDSRLDLEPNTDYVLSGYVKAQSDVRLATRWFRYVARWINQVITFNATTDWTKFTVKFSMPDEQMTGAFLDLIINVPMDNAVSFKLLKLEKGNIATDWTPAPEDTQSQLDEKASTATLDEFKRTQAQKDTATASQISQLTANASTAQNTANTANGKADTATTKADNAQNTANNALNRANTANTAITNEQKARADADTALGQRITAIDTAYKTADSQANAKIATLEQAVTTANQAIATAQSQLTAKFDSLKVGGRNLILNSKQTLTVPAGGASNQESHKIRMNVANIDWTNINEVTLSVDVKHANDLVRAGSRWYRIGFELIVKHIDGTTTYPDVTITAPQTSDFSGRITATRRINKPIRTVEFGEIWVQNINSASPIIIANPKCEIGNVATDWTLAPEDVQNELTNAVAVIDTLRQSVATANSATASQISTLQTTLGGQSASLQTIQNSVNGIKAEYAVKVDSGGRVSGFGLVGTTNRSDFAVSADKFYIAPPTGSGKGSTPFTVLTSPQTINGVRVPAGTYINSAYIANGSIDIAKINKASIQSLSALSANIGHFKSAETGARLEIRDSLLSVYDANNVLRVRLGLW